MLELIATGLFVIVICTVATDDRAPWKGVMAPLLIGLFIFTAADAIGPASGGSFNPARSLDPVMCNWDFGDVWIYLVGPLVGGTIGGAIWVLFGPAGVDSRERSVQPAASRKATRRPRVASETRSAGRIVAAGGVSSTLLPALPSCVKHRLRYGCDHEHQQDDPDRTQRGGRKHPDYCDRSERGCGPTRCGDQACGRLLCSRALFIGITLPLWFGRRHKPERVCGRAPSPSKATVGHAPAGTRSYNTGPLVECCSGAYAIGRDLKDWGCACFDPQRARPQGRAGWHRCS